MGANIRVPRAPRFGLGGGNYHTYYYMHPCLETVNGDPICRDDMPFSLLGHHYVVNSYFTTLDYLIFELYDANGDIYYLWLSGSIHQWINSQNMVYSTPLYDEIDPIDPVNDLVAGATIRIGSRFQVIYTQSCSSCTAWLRLYIDGCLVSLHITPTGLFIDHRYRNHYMYLPPPECK